MRTSIISTAICMSVVGMSAAMDVEAAIRRPTHVSAQGLGPALQTLAREHDFQVLYRTEVVGELRTAGAVGELSTTEALTKLLGGTGLTYLYLDENTVTIVPLSAISTEVNSGSETRTSVPLSEHRARNGREGASPAEGRRSFWSRIRLAQADQEESATAGAVGQSGGSTEQMPSRIEEIIVTAQKRSERLQDVPISMSVLSGVELDKSTAQGVTEMLNRVPAVATTLSFQGSGAQVAIRGVTAATSNGSGASPVAYYLDSAPFGFVTHAFGPDINAYDLERVEVLRGPQSTLYGASALNGVVRVLTRDADLNKTEFKARGSISSTQDGGENYRGDVALNIPIVEGKLAARAVAGHQGLSGWIDRPNRKDANEGTVDSYRLRIDGQPTDRLSIGLSAWLSRSDLDAPPVGTSAGTHRSTMKEANTSDYDVYNVKIGYDFERFSLTSASSYLDYSNTSLLDETFAGGSTIFSGFDSQMFAQEIVLNSTQGTSWRWSLGGIYRDAEDETFQLRPFPFYLAPAHVSVASDSFAVFGELTRVFQDGRFELTGGLRYFEDNVSSREHSRSSGPLLPSQLINLDDTFDTVSPRVALTWKPDDQMTVYASYSEGFRSGAFQSPLIVALAPDFPPVDGDTLTNYEVGTKASLWEGRVRLDAAVYYIDWQDVQQIVAIQVSPLVFRGANFNGESASGPGMELSVAVEPANGFELGASVSWNDLTMDAPVLSRGFVLFAKGDRLNLSPEYTASAFLDYAFPLGGSGLKGQFSASANYTSEQSSRTAFPTAVEVGTGDELLFARTSFAVHGADRWTSTLFVDNVTNEQGTSNTFFSRALRPEWDVRPRPRTVGLQLEYRF